MSGFITAEGLVVPIGSDFYDYTGDQRRLANSIRSVVAIANQAAGDTVATNMSSDGRAVSDTNPLITWNAALQCLMVKGTNGWVPADAKYMRHAEYNNGGGWSVTGGQAWDIGTQSVNSSNTFNNTFSSVGSLSGQLNILETGIYAVRIRLSTFSSDPGSSQMKLTGNSGVVYAEATNPGGSGNGLWEWDLPVPNLYLTSGATIRGTMKTTNTVTCRSDLYVTKLQG